jgi:hypothetical protein
VVIVSDMVVVVVVEVKIGKLVDVVFRVIPVVVVN